MHAVGGFCSVRKNCVVTMVKKNEGKHRRGRGDKKSSKGGNQIAVIEGYVRAQRRTDGETKKSSQTATIADEGGIHAKM